jgi:acyl-CoA synthetase (AMP-forming)/AMP-acid ligase II
MNAFEYFFEKTHESDELFLVGKENLSFRQLYRSSILLGSYMKKEFGQGKNILLLSVNNQFFLTAYFAIIKSGNVCIPLDPNIETENFIHFPTDKTCSDLHDQGSGTETEYRLRQAYFS